MKMDSFHQTFDSIEEFVSYAGGGARRSSNEPSRDGNPLGAELGAWGGGFETWAEVERAAYFGWTQGLERIKRMRLAIMDHLESFGLEGLEQAEEYDVSGASVDVGLFCEGEPECMVEYVEQMMPRARVARVLVQINYLANVTCEEAERRGVAICAMIDALESSGIRCELWAVDWTFAPECKDHPSGHEDMYRHAVLIKKAGQPLPLDRIAFALGHPSFYRGVSFAVRYRNKGWQGGRTCRVPAYLLEDGDLYFEPMIRYDPQWSSDDKALEWAIAYVQKFIEETVS